jgi:hypothetical protein
MTTTYSAIYWFACLDKYLEQGDLEKAAKAVQALRGLGYQIRCRRPRQKARR